MKNAQKKSKFWPILGYFPCL